MAQESKYPFFDDEPMEERPTFEQALRLLKAGEEAENAEVLIYGLSNLNDEQLAELMPVWRGLDADFRHLILQMLTDEMQLNYDLSYDQLAQQGLQDADERIRRTSIELLVAGEDRAHLGLLLHHAEHDRALAVRTDALRGIAAFCKEGAYEDFQQQQLDAIQAVARQRLAIAHDADERGAALELLAAMDAAAFSLIRDAYESDDEALRMSAVVAMGYTADADAWREIVMHELEHGNAAMLREAARACGALELTEAVPALARLLDDEEADAREIVIWSLGEIGGKEAVRILNQLAELAEEDEDDDLLERIEDALANASLADGSDFLSILS